VQTLRAVYRYATVVVAAMVVVQIGAAGFGAFNASEHLGEHKPPLTEDVFDDGFDFHTGFGYLVFIAAVVLLVLALAARLGRGRILQVVGLVVMVAVQIVLAWAAESTHWVGPFHALLAFAILGLSGRLVYEAWRGPAPAVST
jgi:Family of unknown function (DUF6220)